MDILPKFAGMGILSVADVTPLAASVPASAAAPGPSSAAPPAVVVASSALALPICQSYAAPAAAQSPTGLGGRIPAAAAASEDPATSSDSVPYSAPSRSASAAGPWLPQVKPLLLPP